MRLASLTWVLNRSSSVLTPHAKNHFMPPRVFIWALICVYK